MATEKKIRSIYCRLETMRKVAAFRFAKMTPWLAPVASTFAKLCFAFHFTCTALYLLPVNALTARLYPFVASYMHPHFRQNWSLFAPDPDGKTKHFQFRCRVIDAGGSEAVSDMYDASEPFYSSVWTTRLGPGMRLHRAYTSPLSALSVSRSKAFRSALYLAAAHPALVDAIEAQRQRHQDRQVARSRIIAARLAASACKQEFPHARIVETNPMFDIVHPRPFHLRSDSTTPTESVRIDFGWVPAESSLLPR